MIRVLRSKTASARKHLVELDLMHTRGLLGGFVNAYHTCIAPTRVLTLGHTGWRTLWGLIVREILVDTKIACRISTDGETIWMVPEGDSTLIVIVSVRHEGVQDRKGTPYLDPVHLCNARARSWGFV